MLKNWKAILASTVLSASMFGAGAALTSAAHAQVTAPVPYNQGGLRGERGSNHNIHWVRRRVETLLDELQRDQRDYGGHRIAAINLMQQARNQLLQAEQWDASHPGR